MHIPDFVPDIKAGSFSNPKKGGCVMQVTSFLFDGGWTDKPVCTDAGIGAIAISINDAVGDVARRGLLAAVPDLTGTAWHDLEPEEEDAAVTRLDEWARATFPYQYVQTEGECKCCIGDRWVCLAERIEMAVSLATTCAGPIPDFSLYLGYHANEGVTVDFESEVNLVGSIFGYHVAHAMRNRPADHLERQRELVAWFVEFVRKYRDEFGITAAAEVEEIDWRRVAEHMAVPA